MLDTTPIGPPQEKASSKPSSGLTSSRVIPSSQPPQRPFMIGKRQESPASSTGGSSNGKAPLTPNDGSDYFAPDIRSSGDSPNGSAVGVPSAMKGGRGHAKRVSAVSFSELPPELAKEDKGRGRSSSVTTAGREIDLTLEERENRRRDRRRSEAKAAIEVCSLLYQKLIFIKETTDSYSSEMLLMGECRFPTMKKTIRLSVRTWALA